MTTKTEKYRIEREGALEYIVVRCPHGHLSRGQKVDDLRIRQTLTCTNTTCNAQWTEVLPSVLGYEAIE
ncbi:MAG: hypothetical protein ACYC46_07705 [Acidobacteriaceae bacterium]